MEFTGHKWWEHKNTSYREACFRKAIQETRELNSQYVYLMKHIKTTKMKTPENEALRYNSGKSAWSLIDFLKTWLRF